MLKEWIGKEFPIMTEEEFRLIPKFHDPAWEQCESRRLLLEQAKKVMEQPIPELTATMFLDYYRSGSRSGYESNLTYRLVNLLHLCLAQCVWPQEQFIEKMADYIWAICEQTSWTPPAHNNHYYTHYPDKVELPRFDADRIYVDLVASMTGSFLAGVYYLFRDELDNLCPLISKRLVKEVTDRFLLPILNYDDFGWMGLAAEGRINNWNPWIMYNALFAAMCLPMDQQQRRLFFHKSFLLLDQFLNYYHPDGGCDEGPSYFFGAGSAMIEALELIRYATHGTVDLMNEPLIQNMGLYIERASICGRNMANFGDNIPRHINTGRMIFRLGELLHNERIKQFGLFEIEQERLEGRTEVSYAPQRMLEILSVHLLKEKIDAALPAHYQPKLANFLPDIMVLTARETVSCDGFSIAAKGGHNDESHNHNDVGQVMVYLDQKPIMIDPGQCAYTAKTFSPQRYEIPLMQSGCHNLPTVNGVMERDGIEYCATVLDFQDHPEKTELSVEIGKAYPEEAGLHSLVRTTTLDREKGTVTIEDAFSGRPGEIVWNLMIYGEPTCHGNQIETKNGCRITLTGLSVSITARFSDELDDSTQNNWEHQLYHVQAAAKTAETGTLTILFEKG